MSAALPQTAGPRDMHELLDLLRPLGWEKSIQPRTIWRPVGELSCRHIQAESPGVCVVRGEGVPVGGFRGTLGEVLEYVKKMEGV